MTYLLIELEVFFYRGSMGTPRDTWYLLFWWLILSLPISGYFIFAMVFHAIADKVSANHLNMLVKLFIHP